MADEAGSTEVTVASPPASSAAPSSSPVAVASPGGTATATAPAANGTSSSSGRLALYGFSPGSDIGLEDISPFVVKAMTYLKLAGWQYDYLSSAQHGMKGMPRGKLPVLRTEDGVTLVPDSQNIIDHLEARRAPSDRLDAHLSEEQRALALVMRRTAEESFYWTGLVHCRWVEEAGWAITKEKYFGSLPAFFKLFLGLFRKNVRTAYKGQGDGRRPPEEVVAMAKAELDAFATLLGEGPFFLGSERPTTLDCTMYAFISAVVRDHGWYPFDPVRQHVQQALPALQAYVDRMGQHLAQLPPPPTTPTA